MIDYQSSYESFLEINCNDDLFLYAVLTDDKKHPIESSLSILFVKNFKTGKMYHFSIQHQDSPKTVELDVIVKDISKFKGRLFVLDKKSFIQNIPIKSVLDINLGLHLLREKVITPDEYQTEAHKFIYQKHHEYSLLNKVIPLMKHMESMDKMCVDVKKIIKFDIFKEEYFLKINSVIVDILSETEMNGIFVDKEKFKKHFEIDVKDNGFVHSQYNLNTATGRPSNRFGGVNYAALKKDDGSRECFISRFGDDGLMVLMDYSAFHPRIICELTNFKLGLEVDVYTYLAKLFFSKDVIDSSDIDDAKSLTFKQLYGGVDEEYEHIRYFHNLKGFIESNWNRFKQDGYIKTPLFGRKIAVNQIQDANPNKLFNYILQSTETEIAVPILGEVNKFLKDKRSKTVLYTYDSILFDVYNNELEIIKNDVRTMMMSNNRFPIKCYTGKSYADLKQISL